MMQTPEISVIVPIYNVSEYLPACLNSILKQDFNSFEIVAVDDGSTDQSGKIADEYAQRFPEKIRVVHQVNQGLGGARNTGIESARGKYIAFIDSDDTIALNMLSCLWKECQKTGADIAVCGITSVTETGQCIKDVRDSLPCHKSLRFFEQKKLINIEPSACNKLYAKSLFFNSGIRFPTKVWYEDLRTTTKILTVSKGVVFTDRCLYYYFQRSGSIIRNTNLTRNREIIDAVQDVLQYYRKQGLFEECFSELEYLAIYHLFIAASVRIIQIDPKNIMLDEIAQYMDIHFPNFYQNKYLPLLGRNKTLIFKCLYHKQYKIIQLIFKIKTALERLR